MSNGLAFSANGKIIQSTGPASVAAVYNSLYEEYCGACHFVFQPGLLPAKSWEVLVDGLADHFEENAELLPAEAEVVKNYLLDNAADQAVTPLGRMILDSIPPKTIPLRITETPYLKTKHQLFKSVLMDSIEEEIPYSNCIACHPGVQAGNYYERTKI